MKPLHVATLLAGLMAAASIAGIFVRPPAMKVRAAPRYVLETAIPRSFSDWRELPSQGLLVNPQTKALLDQLYSQVLTRTYVNGEGYRIMLSLAYGDDQRGTLKAHKPELCYPAQGFTLHSSTASVIATPYGNIETRRLSTSQGQRKEPVTYWFTMGDRSVQTLWQQRLVELRSTLTGEVPDGLLFRISSIDANPERAYAQHQAFANDLLSALPIQDRARLTGLTIQAAR